MTYEIIHYVTHVKKLRLLLTDLIMGIVDIFATIQMVK